MIEYVPSKEQSVAIIIRSQKFAPGVKFVTPNEYSQQLAMMSHPTGTLIPPHTHNRVSREITFTQEVLIIKKGRLRVDFYDSGRCYLESRILEAGDLIQLVSGGHGFEVLEDIEMIEIKQGPYAGESDKDRFDGVTTEKIQIVRSR